LADPSDEINAILVPKSCKILVAEKPSATETVERKETVNHWLDIRVERGFIKSHNKYE